MAGRVAACEWCGYVGRRADSVECLESVRVVGAVKVAPHGGLMLVWRGSPDLYAPWEVEWLCVVLGDVRRRPELPAQAVGGCWLAAKVEHDVKRAV